MCPGRRNHRVKGSWFLCLNGGQVSPLLCPVSEESDSSQENAHTDPFLKEQLAFVKPLLGIFRFFFFFLIKKSFFGRA